MKNNRNRKQTKQQQQDTTTTKQKNTTVRKLMSCNVAAGDLNKYKRERRRREGDRQTDRIYE